MTSSGNSRSRPVAGIKGQWFQFCHGHVGLDQIFIRDLLYLFYCHRINAIDVVTDQIAIEPGRFQHADFHGLIENRVTLIHITGRYLGFDSSQFTIGYGFNLDAFNLLQQGLLELADGFPDTGVPLSINMDGARAMAS